MTTAQVVETPVTVNKNSLIQDYVHPDEHTKSTYNIMKWLLGSNLSQNENLNIKFLTCVW